MSRFVSAVAKWLRPVESSKFQQVSAKKKDRVSKRQAYCTHRDTEYIHTRVHNSPHSAAHAGLGLMEIYLILGDLQQFTCSCVDKKYHL